MSVDPAALRELLRQLDAGPAQEAAAGGDAAAAAEAARLVEAHLEALFDGLARSSAAARRC